MFLAESQALDFDNSPLGIEVFFFLFLYMGLTWSDPQWITVFPVPLEELTATPLMQTGSMMNRPSPISWADLFL